LDVTKPAAIVQRLWNYCHVLRDDGVSYGDYVEQLTYLLFLKLAAGREQSAIPPAWGWASLLGRQGEALKEHYERVLRELGQGAGLIGVIFGGAQNKIQDPARLRRVIELIDGENWSELDMDLKGAIYEGLLEKNAQDVRSGAGQYFTPRPLIQAMVDVLRPGPGQRICDPAAGTGGFLLAAHAYVLRHNSPDRQQRRHLRREALRGWEIVPNTARLCVMNLYLRGVGTDGEAGLCPIRLGDALEADPGERFDLVLTNPPFGKKGSAAYARDDFWTQTTNKQLNFVQHVWTILKAGGRAGLVLPDNVLFEGGAGETVRRKLLAECDVHTLLRLPTGIFYAPGVKANVLFFVKRATSGTRTLWVYDLRTNKGFTPKQSPLARADLDEFVACYNPGGERTPTWSEHNPQGRWRAFGYEELLARDKANLDIFWLRDESLPYSANLPAPGVLVDEIARDLEAALEQFRALAGDLGE
jgi:type I restriction enzyme M protein